ncbi:non-ribosomal peptide synthetase/type I polyketide synthase [Acanthopleuribacter pedis]|uniref:Amino acid adenylation domain-containing protein n=1 Tax=Acanthopleuribacter pedis TaxID=442870 RepID=A0A8J7QDZ3_9BACT|nr:non-ribosomal peptide synthetase/type I polyketide synthase [Acanthopleuribacter pedis]MBO1317348.1 amino acid adenylation domain-containing protein [Acanthopleuribacter pedis]MBO1318655.1 amino acid adenylation domain-containing protein [Acanthopleuribacter pedis]
MSRKNIEAILPLSPAQEGMWLESMTQTGLHLEQSHARLRGPLDAAALERAWQWLVQRHEMLRTGFVGKDLHKPVQVVYRRLSVSLSHLDLREGDGETAFQRFLAEDRAAGFHPARAPLMRFTLCRFGAEEHRLVWTHHHLLMDGWCISLIFGDLFAAYRAFRAGRDPQAPPAPAYRDYLAWRAKRDTSATADYWRSVLQDVSEPTPLATTAEPAPADTSHALDDRRVRLSPEKTRRLQARCRRARITLNSLFQGLWAVLLARYSGRRDVLYGITVSGRPPELDGVDRILGLFATTQPLRCQLNERLPFFDQLSRLQADQLVARNHEALGGGALQPFSGVPTGTPLYESVLVFENYPMDPDAVADLDFTVEADTENESGARTHHPLVLMVAVQPEGLALHLVYQQYRLDGEAADRVLDHLTHLLGRLEQDEAPEVGALIQALPEPLPRIFANAPVAGADYTAPRNPREEAVAAIWCAILGREQVGVTENFFQAGGHSLLATRLLAQLRKTFRIDLPLRALFDNPTVALQADLLAPDCTRGAAPIPRQARNQPLPLAFTQERLLFLDRLAEGRGQAYHERAAVELGGVLDRAALEGALEDLVARHEALRTSFRDGEQGPVQVIAARVATPLRFADRPDLNPLPVAEAVARIAAEAPAFNLAEAPLFRVSLVRLAPERHLMLLHIHHIITDGWSHALFMREWQTLYAARTAGHNADLAPLPLQFADYAAWLRQRFARGDLAETVHYWTEQLKDAPPLSTIPTDRPRGEALSGRAATVSLQLNQPFTRQLAAHAQQHSATLFMLCSAAMHLLLARLTGRDDVLLGMPHAGRDRAELEPVFGFFVNTLVQRARIDGNAGFNHLLEQVRNCCLDAFAHAEMPFEKLVEGLQPQRALNHTPLFQVFINMLNHEPVRLEAEGLRVVEIPLPETEAMFDLTWYIRETATGLHWELRYNRDLYDVATMDRVLHQLAHLLREAIRDGEQAVAALALAPAAPALPEPPAVVGEPIHAAFLRTAAASPNRIALRTESDPITYAELERWSAGLAAALQREGVRRGEITAIYAERGPALVAAVLASLRLGSPFTILDPAYPAGSLINQLEAADPKTLLRDPNARPEPPALAAYWASKRRLTITCKDDGSETRFSDKTIDAAAPAYIMFTSGTAGKPKGVVGNHAAVTHFLAWQRQTFNLTAADRFILLAGLGHDPLLRDLFAPLSIGATLTMPAQTALESGPALSAALAANHITTLHLTPQRLRLLGGEAASLPDLKQVFCGGDRLFAADVRALRRLSPRATVVNSYGTTETPQIAACHIIPPETPAAVIGVGADGSIPIGRGTAGARLWIRNAAGNTAAPGELGTIVVRSNALCLGFLGQSTRIGPDYVTGDLGRRDDDGTVRYEGRGDRQLNLRGNRIEPAMVEHQLQALAAVARAHVGLRRDPNGNDRLIAWWVPAAGRGDAAPVRAALCEQLPPAMVPEVFAAIQEIPLTPNGKTDSRALPEPAWPTAHAAYEPPRDSLEHDLCSLFAAVLEVERVGRNDDFFERGGHSLKAMQLVGRLHAELSLVIPLRAIFKNRTPAALARTAQHAGRAALQAVPVAPPADTYPLAHAQQRLWLLWHLDPAATTYHMGDVLCLEGKLDRDALGKALEGVIQRHAILRTHFPTVNGEPRQRILDPAPYQPAFIDLGENGDPRAAAEEQAQTLLTEPFDLAAKPPVRFTLLRLNAETHWLLFSIHHILCDRWSLGLIAAETATRYNAAKRAEGFAPTPLPIQYHDYAAWSRQDIDGLAEGLAYWRGQLSSAPAPLELPADFTRPALLRHDGAMARVPLAVSRALCEGVGRTHGAGLFMVLSALVKALLYRVTGRTDFNLGTPVAGRFHPDLEQQIGCYANMVVLRQPLQRGMTFSQLLAAVRETAEQAYSHQNVPFDLLVEELNPQRDLSRSPLFDVVVVLQEDAHPAELDGLQVTSLPHPHRISKFDLSFIFEKAGDDLLCHLEYRTDLYRAERINRLADQLNVLAGALLAEPGRVIDRAPLMSVPEQALIAAPNQTEVGYPECDLVTLFEQQAARHGNRRAVIGSNETLNYRALNRQANRLAHTLKQRHGVVPGAMVGLCLDRSPAMIIAQLAVLKTGAAYVPLDASYPDARLQHMLAATQPVTVLCEPGQRTRLAELGASKLLDWGAPLEEKDTNLGLPLFAELPAYVIFTSGSTGLPKGCVLTHRNLVRLVQNDQHPFDLGPDDVWVCAHSFCFDFSVWEVFGALLHGAAVVVAETETVRDIGAFYQLLRREQVTVLNQTPAAFYNLIEEDGKHPAALGDRLRYVIFGGDRLEPFRLKPWLARYGADTPALINMYGITETCVHVSFGPITAADAEQAGRSPIGGPLPDTRMWLLDEQGEARPVGLPGDIYVGGGGLAMGYWGQPALTAARFVPDPRGNGARLYCSGDVGVLRADGGFDHLGRNDFQIQLRGFRVEPGEIEAALCRHARVREALVLATGAGETQQLHAFLVSEGGVGPAASEWRTLLKDRLPDYMVPATFTHLATWPLTANGKIDRGALVKTLAKTDRTAETPASADEQLLRALWRELLGHDAFGADDTFFDVGGNSLLLVRLRAALEKQFNREVPITELFRHTSIRAQSALLGDAPAENTRQRATAAATDPIADADIAVIGMAGRFPGAASVAELWQNLLDGVESVTFFSADELRAAGVPDALIEDPAYVPAKPVMADADRFDAAFFGFTPREAEVTDPQHRIFLQCAWNALEDAGIDPNNSEARIGVFAGCGANGYLLNNVVPNREQLRNLGDYPLLIGNDKDYLATRTAYKLNLRGPAITVGTACSTSLVALHLAVESLRRGECEAALVGGVSIKVPLVEGYAYQQNGILSPDGHCRAFDAAGQGTIGGSGCAVVVVKPLHLAVADGDPVVAVIKGSAVNNDGREKIGFTAPAVDGQAAVIDAALKRAGVHPEQIGYVEAHGTGTALGDPIEIAALTEVYRRHTQKTGTCAIGSVKTNIGHLDAAAGITGFIKASLAVARGRIPKSLHFDRANPEIPFETSPFRVAAQTRDWPLAGRRHAAVSSFGIGGSNAHVILAEAPVQAKRPDTPKGPRLLVLSAKSEAALNAGAQSLADHVARAQPDLDDLAHTLQSGRACFPYRRHVVAEDTAQAVTLLRTPATGVVPAPAQHPKVVFLFPGQGAQHVGMGRELYAQNPLFRAHLDAALQRLTPLLQRDPRALLFGEDPEAEAQVGQTEYAQPLLFAVSYAAARMWQARGVNAHAMLGHSLGEYVAACLAGVFSLDDALRLVVARGRCMQAAPRGTMLAVSAAETRVRLLLPAELSLAAINAPERIVVSGPQAPIDAFAADLTARDIAHRALHTSHAFHSPMMTEAAKALHAVLDEIELTPPKQRYLSNLTGTWITDEQAVDPGYYAQHILRPVRFSDAVTLLESEGDPVYLEVGPGQTLTTLVGQAGITPLRRIPTLPHPRRAEDAVRVCYDALGRLWQAGVGVDWQADRPARPLRRISFPGYAFQGARFWLDAGTGANRVPTTSEPAATEKNSDLSRWFYKPDFTARARTGSPVSLDRGLWLVFHEPTWNLSIADQLNAGGAAVVTVEIGEGYQRRTENRYHVRLGVHADMTALIGEILKREPQQLHIVHAWSGGDIAKRERGYGSLLHLARALQEAACELPIHLQVVTKELWTVAGENEVNAETALLLGPLRVLPQEMPNLRARVIDIHQRGPRFSPARRAQLHAELLHLEGARSVLLRDGDRWEAGYRALQLPEVNAAEVLRPGGTYLIAGGLGGIGLLLAEWMAREAKANLVLIGRGGLPARETWPQWRDAATATAPAVRFLAERATANRAVRLDLAEITPGLEADAAHIIAQTGGDKTLDPRLIATVDTLCTAYLRDFFRERGVDLSPGTRHTRASVVEQLAMPPAYAKFANLMLQTTIARGLFAEENGLTVTDLELPDAGLLSRHLKETHPHMAGELAFLETCVRQYGDVFDGRTKGVQVLYPEGDTQLVRGNAEQTDQSEATRRRMALLTRLIDRILAAADQRPVRILEVGGGNGLMTRMLAAHLRDHNVRYTFTDIGRAFVLGAQREAAERGDDFMDFGVFDISRDPAAQGFEPHQYDFILGLNVVHATPILDQTLTHLQCLLAPGGMLAMVETVKLHVQIDMIWGLIEGWWCYEDTELRQDSPLMDLANWEAVCRRNGFAHTTAFPRDEATRKTEECGLIVAQQALAPTSDTYQTRLAEQAAELIEPMRTTLDTVTRMEGMGAQVLPLRADVGDIGDLAAAVDQARAHFGAIHGVVNAAGETGHRSIFMPARDLTRADSLAQFRARVRGTRALDHVLAEESPDFAVLISSNASVLGGLGFASYAAACSFMDAWGNGERNLPWVSSNWDRWPTARVVARGDETQTSINRFAMDRDQCEAAFARLIARGEPGQLVVSAGRLDARLARWVDLVQPDRAAISEKTERGNGFHARPNLPNPYQAPATPEEHTLIELLQSLLAIEPVGINDDFFQLGGDSLLGTQFMTRAGKHFNLTLPLQFLFEDQTAAKLAQRIADLRAVVEELLVAPEGGAADDEEEGEL